MNQIKTNKKRRKNKELFMLLIKTLIEVLSEVKHSIVEELGKIAVIIQILIPVLISRIQIGILGQIIVSCLLLFVVKIIKELDYKINNTTDRGLPVPKESYIDRNRSGLIRLKEGMEHEAILYLDDVEEFLRSKGLLK